MKTIEFDVMFLNGNAVLFQEICSIHSKVIHRSKP